MRTDAIGTKGLALLSEDALLTVAARGTEGKRHEEEETYNYTLLAR